jgi:hypothetical protein
MSEEFFLEIAQGIPGVAATVAVGDTTTLAEGQSATVANSGDENAADLDFGIPRGAIPAVGFNFDMATTDADPGAGDVRFNNATPASVTEIYFDNADRDGNTVTSWLDSFDDSTATIKGTLVATPAATPSAKLIFNVTGSVVDGTGYRKVTVTHVAGTTLPSSAAHLGWTFSRTGNNGLDGEIAGDTGGVDNAVLRADGTGGTTLQASPVTIADTTGVIAGTQGVTFTGPSSGTTALVPTAAASGTLTLPAATDQLVGRATTDTLTNKTLTSPTLTTPVLGTPSSGTLTNCTGLPVAGITASTSTALGVGSVELGHATDTTLSRSASGVLAVEGVEVNPGIPINSKSAAYTAVIGDANETILHAAADNNARTFTIPANASVAYPLGTTLTFINEINTVTISITSDTLTLAGAGTTGSRTLAANGMATAIKITSTKWMISGTGLT